MAAGVGPASGSAGRGQKAAPGVFGKGGSGGGLYPPGEEGRLGSGAGAGLKEPSRNRRVCAYNQFITAEHMASISPGVTRRGGKQTERAM